MNPWGISQLMRSVQGLPVEAPTAAAPGRDADVLTRELSRVFMEQLRAYRKAKDNDGSLLDSGEFGWEKRLERIREKSPDQVTFDEIECLSRDHPEEALARWEEVKAADRQDLANGWHAARGVSFEAWDRARFLAIREQFHLLWPPRNGVESMLLDEIAQYEMLRQNLVGSLSKGPWIGNYESGKAHQATVEIGRMIERLQRLIHYALRTLVGIRRAQPVVQRQTIAAIEEH